MCPFTEVWIEYVPFSGDVLMHYVRLENGLPKEITETHPGCGDHWVMNTSGLSRASGWISTRDLPSFSAAKTLATYLTAMTGKQWIGVDEGEVYPRFRVIEAPQIGDFVSKSFNGDAYPVGTITKISSTWQVTTDAGVKFRRYRETGGWKQVGGTWWMIKGRHDERTPRI
jgi:hypothetical protein